MGLSSYDPIGCQAGRITLGKTELDFCIGGKGHKCSRGIARVRIEPGKIFIQHIQLRHQPRIRDIKALTDGLSVMQDVKYHWNRNDCVRNARTSWTQQLICKVVQVVELQLIIGIGGKLLL